MFSNSAGVSQIPYPTFKFRENLLISNHCFRIFSCFSTVSKSCLRSPPEQNKFVSSANTYFNNLDTLQISFIYSKNSLGPSTEPCGTCGDPAPGMSLSHAEIDTRQVVQSPVGRLLWCAPCRRASSWRAGPLVATGESPLFPRVRPSVTGPGGIPLCLVSRSPSLGEQQTAF